MNTYKLLRSDNSFNWEAGIATLQANAPDSIASPGSISIKNCKDTIQNPDNKCKASMEIARCLYNDNPLVSIQHSK